ncbi:MAG: sugar transferase [Streptomyces turgidiscabies]|nr:sugar transferase [Streptomyces turgidiscabies]
MHTVDRVPPQALPALSVVRLTLARRILDVAVVLPLLLMLAPLLMLLALLVAVTSGIPVLFRQRRIGAGGREFTLYKFRSMRTGSTGPGVTGGSDARVTRTGRILRRLSLDELPQL